MSKCNVVRVHYLNISSDKSSVQSLGVYEVDDFGIDPEDENTMRLSWLISNKATRYVGTLAFTIQFACMTGFKVDYTWQSGVFSTITVSDAIDGAEVIIEEYADILQQWKEQLFASSELPISIMSAEDFKSLDGETERGMLYMISDDPSDDPIEKIPFIEQSVAELSKEVGSNKNSITRLASEVSTNTDNIASLTEALSANTENIFNLSLSDSTNRADIESLTSDVANVKNDIAGINSMTYAHKAYIDTLASDMSNAKKDITNLDKKLSYGSYETLYDSDKDIHAVVSNGFYIIKAVIYYDVYIDNDLLSSRSYALIDTDDCSEYNPVYASFFLDAPDNVAQHCMVVVERVTGGYKFTPRVVSYETGSSGIYINKKDVVFADVKLYGRCIYENPKG